MAQSEFFQHILYMGSMSLWIRGESTFFNNDERNWLDALQLGGFCRELELEYNSLVLGRLFPRKRTFSRPSQDNKSHTTSEHEQQESLVHLLNDIGIELRILTP